MITSKAFLIAVCVFTLGSLLNASVDAVPNFCSGKVDGDYRDPGSCYTHIKCSNGISHTFACPASTLWDDSAKRCEHLSDLPSCNTPFSCTGRPDGSYPHPAACTSYYVCVAENEHLMPCPATTHYDPALKVCDHAANVRCVPAIPPPVTPPP